MTSMQPAHLLSLTAALSIGFAAGVGLRGAPVVQDREAPAAEAEAQAELDMMAAWMEANAIGERHRLLQPFAGTFTAVATSYMGGESETSQGETVNEWMYDGRYLQGHYTGAWGGQEFHGMFLWGFANADQTYKGIWVDSMSTDMSYTAGWASEDGKTFTMIGTDRDPMSGEAVDFENVFTLESDDVHTMVRYDKVGGERVKSVEIRYTRKQG